MSLVSQLPSARKTRIVVTGTGAVSPFGLGSDCLANSLLAGQSGLSFLPELASIPTLTSHVAGIVPKLDVSGIPRQFRRSMTKMSIYATLATREALRQAGYEDAPQRCALLLGSTMSSMEAWLAFSDHYLHDQLDRVKATSVFQMMNHSPLANVAQALNIQGMGLGNCAACATGLLNIGLGYQLIKSGWITSALCGGTEEYHPMVTSCFNIMNAASSAFNDAPQHASRPFDRRRDGIVCSEGCGMLMLESLESAEQRGVDILAEIVGFASNTETHNIATPCTESIEQCMRQALESAGVKPAEVDFVNAHATGTLAGDGEECQAIRRVFGSDTPVNSFKGHLGHSLAASGSLELIAALSMMRQGHFAPTLNLETVADDCQGVQHVQRLLNAEVELLLKNSFALGGTNCSLLIQKFRP
jgi:3-oxoacyl-[acyl-carrier-protein] synthase II